MSVPCQTRSDMLGCLSAISMAGMLSDLVSFKVTAELVLQVQSAQHAAM